MTLRLLAPLASAGLVLSACSGHDCCGLVDSACTTDSAAATEAPAADLAPPAAEPASDLKLQAKLAAISGLQFRDGLVVVDPTRASSIVAGHDAAAAEAAYTEGQVLLAQNELLGAIRAHAKAVMLAPERGALYLGLGQALVTQKGWEDKAAAAYRTGIEHAPDSVELWYHFGDALWRTGDIEASVAAWHRTAELAPNSSAALERLANVAFLQGRDAQAWDLIQRAEARGGSVPTQMRQMLSARSPEPAK